MVVIPGGTPMITGIPIKQRGILRIRIELHVKGGWGEAGDEQHFDLPFALFNENVYIEKVHVYGYVAYPWGGGYQIKLNGIPIKICKDYDPHLVQITPSDNTIEVVIWGPVLFYWIGAQTIVLTIEISYIVFGQSKEEVDNTFKKISQQAKQIEITINSKNSKEGNPNRLNYNNVWGIFAQILQWLPMIMLMVLIFYILSWLPRPRR